MRFKANMRRHGRLSQLDRRRRGEGLRRGDTLAIATWTGAAPYLPAKPRCGPMARWDQLEAGNSIQITVGRCPV